MSLIGCSTTVSWCGRPGVPIGEAGVVWYKDEDDARKSVGGVHVAEPIMEMEPMMTRAGSKINGGWAR